MNCLKCIILQAKKPSHLTNFKSIKNMKNITNLALILEQLQAGKEISTTSVLRTVGTTELRHYIAKIRKTITVLDRKVRNHGENGFHKVYFLKRKEGVSV